LAAPSGSNKIIMSDYIISEAEEVEEVEDPEVEDPGSEEEEEVT
jgi:hypothetical protein